MMQYSDSSCGVHAVLVNEAGKVESISKYELPPCPQPTAERALEELERYYNSAKNNPPLNRDDYGCWDYFMINDWPDAAWLREYHQEVKDES